MLHVRGVFMVPMRLFLKPSLVPSFRALIACLNSISISILPFCNLRYALGLMFSIVGERPLTSFFWMLSIPSAHPFALSLALILFLFIRNKGVWPITSPGPLLFFTYGFIFFPPLGIKNLSQLLGQCGVLLFCHLVRKRSQQKKGSVSRKRGQSRV